MIGTGNRENRGIKFFIHEHEMFGDEKTVKIGSNLSSSASVIVGSMDPIVCVEINQVVVVNILLEDLVFLGEYASSSSFVQKRGDEVEITTKDIDGIGLVLD